MGVPTGTQKRMQIPIKNMQCGKEDGKAFIKSVKEKSGNNISWTKKHVIKF